MVPSVGTAASPAADADCNSHGRLTQHYSVAELHTALSGMPADEKEYTNCYDVIQRQLLAQVSGTHSGTDSSQSGSSGSFLPTPVIVAIVVLALGGATLGAFAIRRRGSP